MSRYANNSGYKKDMPGIQNKTQKPYSFAKGQSNMTSASNIKKTSLSMPSNNCYKSYEKPKPERTSSETSYTRKDQNLMKVASSSATNYNNSKQQPTKYENAVVKPKQDQIQLGTSYKGDQNQSKILNAFSSNRSQQDQKQLGLFQKGDQNQSKTFNSFSNSKAQQDQKQLTSFQKGDQNQSKTFNSFFNTKTQQDQKQIGFFQKEVQNQPKILNPFSNVTSQQDQSKLGKSHKEDQNKSRMSYKEDQIHSKALNSFFNSKPQQLLNNSKSKQDGGLVSKKTEPNLTKISTSSSQPRDVWNNASPESKTLNHSQDNKDNERRNREKFFANYALVKTMKHMWQSPNKNKDPNPMKSSSYVTSEPKHKPDEVVNSSFATHSFWEEQATSKAKNNVPENFFAGQSKLDVKVNDKAKEPIRTETLKPNQSYQNTNLKTGNRDSKENEEEELQRYLLKEPALTALYIGLPADKIKQAIKEKLKQTGTAFTSITELMEAVFNLKKPNEEIGENTLEKNVAVTSTEAIEEDGTFVDRRMLEEIKMLKQEKMCKICLDAEVGIVFIPCGHLLACVKCSENIKNCPLCRVEIQSSVKTFLS